MAESTEFVTLPLSCRCKQLKVTVDVPASSLPLPLILCHCNTCNAVTGQLCATVTAVPAGSKPLNIQGEAKGYKTSGALERFFCETCGSSIYEDASGMSPGLIFLDSGAFEVGEVQAQGKTVPVFKLSEHIFVADAKDGGLRDWTTSVPAWEGWMNKSKEIPRGSYYGQPAAQEPQSQFVSSKDELDCACKCGGVNFKISRPKHGSKHWPEPAAEEIAGSPVTIPRSPEWWMPAEGAKYNAFLCACNDCRFSSGYEVSAWAIIPKKNFRVGNSEEVSKENVDQLQDASTYRNYQSSDGCHRQFCGRCGATLSFFTERMPNVMNVSVGLMKGKSGPRVEEWLQWQTEEIGYETLAQNQDFVKTLAKGLKEWGASQNAGLQTPF